MREKAVKERSARVSRCTYTVVLLHQERSRLVQHEKRVHLSFPLAREDATDVQGPGKAALSCLFFLDFPETLEGKGRRGRREEMVEKRILFLSKVKKEGRRRGRRERNLIKKERNTRETMTKTERETNRRNSRRSDCEGETRRDKEPRGDREEKNRNEQRRDREQERPKGRGTKEN